jgi:hypothetical protein
MPGFKLKERRLPSRRYPFIPFPLDELRQLRQAILYRGASFDIVWRSSATVAAIVLVFFTVALVRFRRTVAGELTLSLSSRRETQSYT